MKTLEHNSPLNFPFCLQLEKLACTFFLLLLFAEKAKLSKALLHSVQNSKDKSGVIASLVFLVFIVNSWCKNNRNALKIKMAGVPKRVIQRYGAVSEETALAMTQGIRRKTGAGVALSVTGIAGPGGGTKKKPVGTVCIACVSGHKRIVEKIQLFGGRSAIQERAAYTALNFIRKSVQ